MVHATPIIINQIIRKNHTETINIYRKNKTGANKGHTRPIRLFTEGICNLAKNLRFFKVANIPQGEL